MEGCGPGRREWGGGPWILFKYRKKSTAHLRSQSPEKRSDAVILRLAGGASLMLV